jgi:hypothetical protein
MALLAFFSVICDAQVRDARGYAVMDSGYLGRPGGIQQDIYWLDNDRVIFIGAKLNDYIEPTSGLRFLNYGLYVWDTKTNAVKLHHEGSLYSSICVFQGYIRLEFDRKGSRYVLEGPFGKENLRRLDTVAIEERRRYERVVNRNTCREYKPAELPALGYRVQPLLEGEFVSREREPIGTEIIHWKYWPRDGSPVLLNMTQEVIGVGRYSAYLDGYVLYEGPRGVTFSDTVIRRSWLMDRNGNVRDFTPPSGPWMRGSTFVAPTKRGLFLLSHAVYGGGNGAAGGYLMLGGELQRVIAGLPTSFDISADGCRVALAISQWSRDKPVTPRLRVVNLCLREADHGAHAIY